MSCSKKSGAQLPAEGYVRLSGVLAVVPVSRTTWLGWVREGKAPKPVKLSERTTAWHVDSIRAFIAQKSK